MASLHLYPIATGALHIVGLWQRSPKLTTLRLVDQLPEFPSQPAGELWRLKSQAIKLPGLEIRSSIFANSHISEVHPQQREMPGWLWASLHLSPLKPPHKMVNLVVGIKGDCQVNQLRTSGERNEPNQQIFAKGKNRSCIGAVGWGISPQYLRTSLEFQHESDSFTAR